MARHINFDGKSLSTARALVRFILAVFPQHMAMKGALLREARPADLASVVFLPEVDLAEVFLHVWVRVVADGTLLPKLQANHSQRVSSCGRLEFLLAHYEMASCT